MASEMLSQDGEDWDAKAEELLQNHLKRFEEVVETARQMHEDSQALFGKDVPESRWPIIRSKYNEMVEAAEKLKGISASIKKHEEIKKSFEIPADIKKLLTREPSAHLVTMAMATVAAKDNGLNAFGSMSTEVKQILFIHEYENKCQEYTTLAEDMAKLKLEKGKADAADLTAKLEVAKANYEADSETMRGKEKSKFTSSPQSAKDSYNKNFEETKTEIHATISTQLQQTFDSRLANATRDLEFRIQKRFDSELNTAKAEAESRMQK